MTDTFRAMRSHPLAQEAYVAFVQICKGGSDDAGTYDADEEIVRRALKRLDELESALLAQPEPVAPTDEEIMELMPQQMRDDLAAAARALAGHFDTSAPIKATGAIRIILNRHAVDHARAVLAKWGRPTPQPETNAFAIVQQRLEQLAGDQELMIYRWPLREDWGIEHTNPSSSVQLGEVSGEYGCTGHTLEEAVSKLAELLPTPEATNE